jgi:Zn-dependent protease with chaperone function
MATLELLVIWQAFVRLGFVAPLALSLGFAIVLVLGQLILIDKILLSLLKASEDQRLRMSLAAENILDQTGSRGLSLYKSHLYGEDVFLIPSFFNKGHLVIGSNLLDRLSERELEALVLMSVASGFQRRRLALLCLFNLMILSLPMTFLFNRNWFKGPYQIFLFPMICLVSKLVPTIEIVLQSASNHSLGPSFSDVLPGLRMKLLTRKKGMGSNALLAQWSMNRRWESRLMGRLTGEWV